MARVIEARGSRQAVLRAYNLFADFYAFWSTLFEEKAILRGLALAQVSPGERVLEVAVGPGTVLVRLRRQAGESGRAVGVDLAPRMLHVARRREPQALLVQADARSLPFGEGEFDLVWSSCFLDLVPTAELTPLLREFRRVLRPGGRLLLVSLSKKEEAPTWWEPLPDYPLLGCTLLIRRLPSHPVCSLRPGRRLRPSRAASSVPGLRLGSHPGPESALTLRRPSAAKRLHMRPGPVLR